MLDAKLYILHSALEHLQIFVSTQGYRNEAKQIQREDIYHEHKLMGEEVYIWFLLREGL